MDHALQLGIRDGTRSPFNLGGVPGRQVPVPQPADLPPIPQTDIPVEEPEDPEKIPTISPDVEDPPRERPESPIRLPGR